LKWNNPSHEYDNAYINYSEYLSAHDGICIFGAGKLGREYVDLLVDNNFNVNCVIDNNPSKWGTEIREGIRVVSFDEYRVSERHGYIIIALSEKNSLEVEKQLSLYGYKNPQDFCTAKKFWLEMIPTISLYRDNTLMLDIVELSLTERCTLRCKKCAHGCCYVPQTKKDFPLEDVKRSADNLFRLADKLNEFYLIGGEPLLYKDLATAISYVGEKYRTRIIKFIITTNGTILPKEDVLDSSRKYDVTFYISNYSATIPQLKERYELLCDLFERNGVKYQLSSIERTWYDYGFDYVDHGFDAEQVQEIHDTCFTRCREIRGEKFYYCIQARSVSENTNRAVSEDDFLDLSKLDGIRGKKVLYEYSQGYCEKGYIDMCNYCNGTESLKYPIPVAEQLV